MEFEAERTATRAPVEVRASGRQPCLVALAGPDEGKIFRLSPDAILWIGRASGSDIPINDDGISRKHAQLLVRPDRVIIEDLASHNGTFVGHERVKSRALQPDDIISVGTKTLLKFCYLNGIEEQAQRRMLAAALRDPVTDLYNRRHFDDQIASEVAAARRHLRPLALAMVDIDDFKRVNDQHGHTKGDAVLRAVADALMEAVRREDMVFRYGGEEFAVLVRETDMSGAEKMAQRLVKSVGKVKHKPAFGSTNFRVTISIGLAAYEGRFDEKAFVDRADAALYRAKHEGKNRVVSAE